MFVVAITGGLGAGKSEAAKALGEYGAFELDLDDVAKRLMAPGSPLLAELERAFPGCIGADGALDRAALASQAFASPEACARLNAIVHPAVIREVGPAITDLRLLPQRPHVVAMQVPLLAEAPVLGEIADLVIAVAAPEELRLARAVARGMGEADARARLACQATDAERAELADVVLENSGTLEELRASIEELWKERIGPHAPQ